MSGDMNLPGCRFSSRLKGDRADTYSLTVTSDFYLCFEGERDAVDVDSGYRSETVRLFYVIPAGKPIRGVAARGRAAGAPA